MQEVFEKIIEKVKENSYMVVQKNNSKELGMTICGFEQVINEISEEFAPDTNVGSNDWIPVSERLPSDCAIHEVTAQFSNGKAHTEFAYYDEAKEEWWKHDDDGLVNVIAWKEPSELYHPKGE